MKKRNLKILMVVLALIPVILTVFLARSLYQRKGVPEALESLTRQLFMSKEDERKAEAERDKADSRTEELKTTYDALIADLKGEVESKEIRIRKFREKLEINFVDKVLFISGSAEITPQGREILGKVGEILRSVRDKKIYIVGHTDNVPINSFVYPSNWELSAARSASVCRFLIDNYALDPGRFTAMGKAYFQPVAANDTVEGRQENRRVEIIIADFPGLEGESGEVEMRSPAFDPGAGLGERDLVGSDEGLALPGMRDGTKKEIKPGEDPAGPGDGNIVKDALAPAQEAKQTGLVDELEAGTAKAGAPEAEISSPGTPKPEESMADVDASEESKAEKALGVQPSEQTPPAQKAPSVQTPEQAAPGAPGQALPVPGTAVREPAAPSPTADQPVAPPVKPVPSGDIPDAPSQPEKPAADKTS